MLDCLLEIWRWCWFSNVFVSDEAPPNTKKAATAPYSLFRNSFKYAPSMHNYYMLEVKVPEGITPFKLTLCAKTSSDQTLNFVLPIKDKGCFKRICYFDETVNFFTANLEFNNRSEKDLKLSFKKISKPFAYERMERKLRKKLGKRVLLDSFTDTQKYTLYDQLFNKADQIVNYQTWINESEPLIWNKGGQNRRYEKILFSIVVPTYNAKPEWLDECFQSVVDQTYYNWELVIVDDASTSISSLDNLKKWKNSSDSRINVIYRESNGHICAATNTGLEATKGDYICFLDHDDMLAPQALNELAIAICENPRAKLIYSDEDLISESGRRIRPHFKPDWNPELLLNHNYVTHLCCYESEMIKQLDGMRNGFDGAQDYDLVLRASRIMESEHIIHVPKILYHWRMVEGSTALSSEAKSYATKAGFRALTEHVAIVNPNAQVQYAAKDNFYKVSWPLVIDQGVFPPKVSIIIPTRDGIEVLKPCIDGLLNRTSYSNFEIIILDNGSDKQETLNYLDMLSKNTLVTVIRDDGLFNYSRINNNAVRYSTGEFICLLNNDIEVIHSDWLDKMVSLAARPNTGCVGAKLLYPDGSIQHAGVILGLGGYAAHAFRGEDRDYPGRAQVSQNLSAVTAACLVVKRSIYNAVGGLDESFQVAYNDVDFCLRVKAAGYNNIYTPDAELYHHESKTRGSDSTPQNSERFESEKVLLLEKWSEVIKHDPAYNPNLTRSREDFSVGTVNAQ